MVILRHSNRNQRFLPLFRSPQPSERSPPQQPTTAVTRAFPSTTDYCCRRLSVSVLGSKWLLRSILTPPCWVKSTFLLRFMHHFGCRNEGGHCLEKLLPLPSFRATPAKRKEAWLIEKLRKYEVRKAAPETYDPEILTEEERFYLKRTGEKKKHYVPVGRRGVFGGVVLNMHLHWKKHETVKVICKPCKPGQVHQYAEELARLSKGIIIDIKPNSTIIFYRGKNYVQPDIMSPTDTISKVKALEKYQHEQSLEHTSEFIEKLENELAEYLEHRARYKKDKSEMTQE